MAIDQAISLDRVYSVSEAAAVLRVSVQRVRALLAAGAVPGRRIGGRWLVDADAVDRRAEKPRVAGRALSPRRAWALLALAAGDRPDFVDAPSRSRLRRRLAEHGLAGSLPLLIRRGRSVAVRAHPGELAALIADPAFVRSGAAAAADYALPLIAPGVVEGYVAGGALDALVARHGLRPSADPNVLLRVVDAPWPFAPGTRVAPLVVVAVDLLEDDDERSRAAGVAALDRLGTPR